MLKVTAVLIFALCLRMASALSIFPCPQGLYWYVGQTISILVYQTSEGDGNYYNLFMESRTQTKIIVYANAPYGEYVQFTVPMEFGKPGGAALIAKGQNGSSDYMRLQIVNESDFYILSGKGRFPPCTDHYDRRSNIRVLRSDPEDFNMPYEFSPCNWPCVRGRSSCGGGRCTSNRSRGCSSCVI